MILQKWMMIGLGVVSMLLIMFLFIWLWKKMKKKAAAGGTLGFFLGIFPMIFFYVAPYNFYVLEGGKNCTDYKVIGAPVFEMKNGTKVQLHDTLACTIVNDSDEDYVLEKVIFGNLTFQEIKKIPAGKYTEDEGYIAYYFDEQIPDYITTESKAKTIRRTRVLTAKDFAIEYPNYGEVEENPETPQEKAARLKALIKKKRAEREAAEAAAADSLQ